MINNSFGKNLLALAACALSLPLGAVAQTTVFSDNFTGGSTVDAANFTPTATSTSYQWFSGLAGGTANTTSDLHLALPSTTSLVGEAQAMFASSPISLATIGDNIQLTIVFTDTANVMLTTNSNSSLAIGLFNSGGAAPNQGVITLNAGNNTGGSQNWKGFSSVALLSSGSNKLLARGPQTANGTTSQNQDLLFNGASSSQTYNSPTATQVGSSKSDTASPLTLTAGTVVTNFLSITLSPTYQLVVSNSISTSAGVLYFNSGTTVAGSLVTTNFDSLSFGWREAVGPAAASSIDVSQVLVTDQISAVPEPTTLALLGGAAATLIFRRRQLRG